MSQADYELARQWYDRKSALMEAMLGKQHDTVTHAMPEAVVEVVVPTGMGIKDLGLAVVTLLKRKAVMDDHRPITVYLPPLQARDDRRVWSGK